jgi:hypothetical protein
MLRRIQDVDRLQPRLRQLRPGRNWQFGAPQAVTVAALRIHLSYIYELDIMYIHKRGGKFNGSNHDVDSVGHRLG